MVDYLIYSKKGQVLLPKDGLIGKNVEFYGPIRIGEGSRISEGCRLYGPLDLGEEVYLGQNVLLGYPTYSRLREMLKDNGKIISGGLETRIGSGSFIDNDVKIYEDSNIGKNVQIWHHASIRERVNIGDNSVIGCYTVIDGPDVEIGDNTFIHASCYICSKTKIGNQVFIGPQVGTINEKTAQSRIGLPSQADYRELENGPSISDFATIGMGAKIMMGVKIGKRASIGAGSLVTKDVPNGEVWVGNPARKLKNRDF